MSFSLQSTIIFIDSEGEPVQELCGIEMCLETKQIVDVFLDYHHPIVSDSYARCNVHGLNPSFLEKHGHRTELSLLTAFKEWLDTKNYAQLFGNAPLREMKLLGVNIQDIKLPVWAERYQQDYHTMANCFKNMEVAFCGKRCFRSAHSSYFPRINVKTESAIARMRHGYHCAFGDCIELYFYYLRCNCDHSLLSFVSWHAELS